MNTALVYLKVVGRSDSNAPPPQHYSSWTDRFLESHALFGGDEPHRLVIVNCGSNSGGRLDYRDAGWDIGAFQFAATALREEFDFIIFMNTACRFWRPGFLERILAARNYYGPGLYGPSSSYENLPHIRTPCFAVDTSEFLEYPNQVVDRAGTYSAESGPLSITSWYRANGKPTLTIASDGNDYPIQNWRDAPNIFRRGDQSNCLIWDRHMEEYRDSSPERKIELERMADGKG